MAENIEVLSQEPTQQHTTDLPAEIRQMMDASFGLGQPAAEPQPPTVAPSDVQPQAGAEAQAPAPKEFFADYGFQTREEFDSAIQEYKTLKSNPAPAPTFANELSEKAFKAVQQGKLDELYTYMEQQRTLDSLTATDVTEENADAILKAGLQLKHPSLTPQEVAYKVSKQFAVPREPVQRADETDDEFSERRSDWKAQADDKRQEKLIEAKLLRPELEAAKQKLVFSIGDDDSEAERTKALAQQEVDRQTKEAYQKLTRTALKAATRFVDESNNIDVAYEFEPDEESFKQVIDAISNAEQFWGLFKGQDGNPDRLKFAKTVYYGLHFEKALLEGMKQAKNATLKSQLADNDQGGLQRQAPQLPGEPDWLQKNMNTAMHGFV